MSEKLKVDGLGDGSKEFVKVDFPSNSHKNKTTEKKESPDKKVTQVTKGKVVARKKGLGKRMTETFLGDDIGSVKDYVIHEVLLPAAKSTFSDMVSSGIEMLLFGETRKSSRSGSNRNKSYVSYNSYYKNDRDRRDEKRDISSRSRARHDFSDIVLDSRGEAEDVLTHLVDLIADYGMVSVADLYDLVGITSNFTDNKYGWTNLSHASVSRVRDGYLLNLPRTVEL